MGNTLSSAQAPSKNRPQPHMRRIFLSKTTKTISGFAESVFNDLDDTERAPGGSLFGCDITNPQPGFTSLFQELGDGVSMVTKTQRVATRERTDQDSDFLVSKTLISAGDPQHQRPSSPVKPPYVHTSIRQREQRVSVLTPVSLQAPKEFDDPVQ